MLECTSNTEHEMRLLTRNTEFAKMIKTSVDEEHLRGAHEQKVAFSNPVDCIGIV